MQNLIRFIRKYYHLLLFAILEIIALTALFRFNRYHQAVFFSTANNVSGRILEKKAEALAYFSLNQENKRLLSTSSTYLNDSFNRRFLLFTKDTFTVKDTFGAAWFTFTPAFVVNNSVHKRRNYLTINAGKLQGVRKNMGVISQDGVVGIVVDVSDNFALVMSLLHDQFKLKPKIAESDYFGELFWNGSNPTEAGIDKISRHYAVKKGQHVVTSSFSHLFPPNIPVGVVTRVEKNIKKPFSDIRIKLATDFGKVRSVYVVKNIFRKEINDLEAGVEDVE